MVMGVMLGGKNIIFVALLGLLWFQISGVAASVSYDSRSLTVNGQRRILISGSIHYPRSTPEMWPDLIRKAKKGGLDVIQTYVFWNVHEPALGHYNFEGRYDLVRFIKLVKEAGLYVHLRIGPYICAEWNFGGFPVWLKYVPGISFRTNNGPFKLRMHKFTKKIVDMMKAEGLFENQGGPIILSQVENEYGALEYEIGSPGRAYTKWAGRMAVGLNTGVPWVMCKQTDAPDPIINTCNGFYCDNFLPNKPYKPKLWTEAWTGWFTNFGGAVPFRPVEDLAFAVAKFFMNGGAFVNYYMYHGGTNFGRTSGGRFVATSYDYDAPLDEYGLTSQPKWGHLKDLHRAIKLCEPALLDGDLSVTRLGKNQEAHIYKSKTGACAAFLANYDTQSSSYVSFANNNHNLSPWSISILPDCKYTVYNTARINAQNSQMKMTPVEKALAWQSYKEDMASYEENTFTTVGLLEQINVTRDASDYLWYMTEVEIDANEEFLKSENYPVLTIMSAGHALNVFINGQLSGSMYGSLENPKLTFSNYVKLIAGINKISLLSISVGLANVGPHFEVWNTGVLGPVSLSGLNKGMRDLTRNNWSYKIGLQGEALSLHSLSGGSSVEWMTGAFVVPNQPLTWYKTTFKAPDGNAPLALDMSGMGKGEVWINGQSIGRHWPAYTSSKYGCPENNQCSFPGIYTERKCRKYCGKPSQTWYHIPRSWLKASDNLLVVFEEMGGNPNWITLVKKEVGSVCSSLFEWQPSFRMQAFGNITKPQRPEARLRCSSGQVISSIKFASFGTPEGVCGDFRQGKCHSESSYNAFEKACIGQKRCKVDMAPENFGSDPCPNVLKKLSVEAVCVDSA